MVEWLTLALSTLISEDVTCVAAGLLVARGQLPAASGITACTIGIVAGDVGLWGLGRFASRVMRMCPWTARWYRAVSRRAADAAERLHRHAATAIAVSRFLPGTRLPLYVAAGATGVSLSTFATASSGAAGVWVPALMMITVALHAGAGAVLHAATQSLAAEAMLAGAAVLALRALRAPGDERARLRIAARLARWRRWEFWPAWVFYAPVSLWVLLLAVWHRGLTTITAANPGMTDGGTVGESKFAILSTLPAGWTIPAILLEIGASERRLSDVRHQVLRRGWSLPLILKPDVGQRGAGVRRVDTWDAAAAYLREVRAAVIAQPYHPGPFEAGVFYYRFPHWPRGRILSITDKIFPEVIGDGTSTLEMLILRHPRARLQSDIFLRRHPGATHVVPAHGQRVRLALAGNHAQGTTFRDGAHLMTSELEARIDEIAQGIPGFFIGRFDIRYASVEAFKAGEDLAIVELNGATAESTNIYDPSKGVWSAYSTLVRQWQLVFAIGAANRRRGEPRTSFSRLAQLVLTHLTTKPVLQLSD
jgi:membrane protein DedA with SNARE-associated domain